MDDRREAGQNSLYTHPKQTTSKHSCPRCHGAVNRVELTSTDHIVSLVTPVHRYRCSNPGCGWEGRQRTSQYQSAADMNSGTPQFKAEQETLVALDYITDAVVSSDPDGCVTYMNVVAENMTGWSRQQATGRYIADVFMSVDAATRRPVANPALIAMARDESVGPDTSSVLLNLDGNEHEIEHTAMPIHHSDGTIAGAVIVFRDARYSLEAIERLAYLARHDALTGLPNRLVLKERAEQAIALGRRHDKLVGLLFVDMDDFKQINDTLGHDTGDGMLVQLARLISRCIRATDTVCRFGGDEFVVLLSEIERRGDADKVASKLLSEVAASRNVAGHGIELSLSIGISVFPYDGEDFRALLQHADDAMYRAKAASKHSRQSVTSGRSAPHEFRRTGS